VSHEHEDPDLGKLAPARLEVVEARRSTLEQLAWQTPGFSFAGQAFLLTIVLNPATTGVGRLLASIAGFAAAMAVLHFYLDCRGTEEIHARWVNARLPLLRSLSAAAAGPAPLLCQLPDAVLPHQLRP